MPRGGKLGVGSGFAWGRLAPETGESFEGAKAGSEAGPVLLGVPAWSTQFRIRSRSARGREAKLNPPVFVVKSVHTSSPLASICWPFSENEKRIVPGCDSGRRARKPRPQSEKFSTTASLFGSIWKERTAFATLRGDRRSSAMALYTPFYRGDSQGISAEFPY